MRGTEKEDALKQERFRRVIADVEACLSSEWSVSRLSSRQYSSAMQLYRDFYRYTGHSVKEYIRRRRLSNALALIRNSDYPLADIAYQAGYSSQQSLCRAVKAAVGMTPLEYARGNAFYYFPPYDGKPVHSVTVGQETIPPTVCLRYYHASLRGIEERALQAFRAAVPSYSGRIFGRNGTQVGRKFCYELYLDGELPETRMAGASGAGGFWERRDFQAVTGTFASCVTEKQEEAIGRAWDFLYSEWLPESMFTAAGQPYFEEYLLDRKRSAVRLFLPVEKQPDRLPYRLSYYPQKRFLVSKASGSGAERAASERVFRHLSENYPYLLALSGEIYRRQDGDTLVCGLRVNAGVQGGEGTSVHAVEEGWYLTLKSDPAGNDGWRRGRLLRFAAENRIPIAAGEMFHVYSRLDGREQSVTFCPVRPAPPGSAEAGEFAEEGRN